VCLTPFAAAVYYVSGGMLIAVVYTYWSGGVPWYLANSFEAQDWSAPGIYVGLACWSITGLLLLLFTDVWVKFTRTIAPCLRPAMAGAADCPQRR